MINFEYHSPTTYCFGRGVENEVGEKTAQYSAKKRAMIVYDTDRIEKNGLLDKIRALLSEKGISTVCLSGVKPNPRIALVREGIKAAREADVDFILPIGGGSVIDTGKAIACGVFYEGDVGDFFTGKAEPSRALALGVILTLAATGSEGSNCAVITNDAGEKAGICVDLIRPKFAIMNPEMTYTVPKWQTGCGSADIMAHIMEAYFTTTEDVDLVDGFIEGLLRTVVKYAPKAIETPDDYNARAQLMWAGTLANSGFFAVGRLSDTAPHALGEKLGSMLTHGATLAVVLPAWMAYTYKTMIPRYVKYAQNVWGIAPDPSDPEKTALKGIKATKDFFRSLGVPVTLKELGVDDGDQNLRAMAEADFGGWDEIPGFFFTLNAEDRYAIYKLATED